MIKIISAVSQNGVIGDANKNTIPWQGKYPEDFKFFRQMTTGGQVIFGRKTYESIGKPLPKRRNVVITRQENMEGVDCQRSLDIFFRNENIKLYDQIQTYWICGGSGIYRDGMEYASEIYLTLIPEVVKCDNPVFFPWIDPSKFKVDDIFHIENSELRVAKYIKL